MSSAENLCAEGISSFTNSLFEEPWWLDAVAPGRWRALEVRRNGELFARLVVDQRTKYGIRIVGNPPLTQTIGPWTRTFEGKQASRLRHENDLVTELIELLPTADIVQLTFAPQFVNPHPFHWARFAQTAACTYRLANACSVDARWAQLSEATRRQVRKAQRLVEVRDDVSAEQMFDITRQTWTRQNLRPPYDYDTLTRIFAAAAARNALLALAAYGDDGQAHAAVCVVHDSRSAHYIVGGGNPALRASGAHSLLMWEAITRLSGRTRVFDFMGSMNPNVERFFRGFGPERALLLQARRFSFRGALAHRLQQWLYG